MAFIVKKAPRVKLGVTGGRPDDLFWTAAGPPILEACLSGETLTAEHLWQESPYLSDAYAAVNGLVTRLSNRGMFRQKIRHQAEDGGKAGWRTALVPCKENAENAAAYLQQYGLLDAWIEASKFEDADDLAAAISELPTAAEVCPALYAATGKEDEFAVVQP